MPKKNSGTFSYPGGKTTIAAWIIDHFPDHTVYVEPFGGSASVLMRKEKSTVEVYNDTNSDCVAFFEAVKSHTNELQKWIKSVPYSRELYDQWQAEFNEGIRPDNIVEQAGRFLYITTCSFSGKAHQGGGTFAVSKSDVNAAQYGPTQWQRRGENVENMRDRFHNVQIESLDFAEIFEKYGNENAFFYCDPPYIDVGEEYYKTGEGFDHKRFVECLEETNAKWLVSYDHNIPKPLQKYHTVKRTKKATMSAQNPEKVETLTMNYNPNDVAKFKPSNQSGLEAFE